MALPLPVIAAPPDPYHLAPHRIKRCTYRRLIDVEGADRVYDVECLFPGRSRVGHADLQRLHRAAHLPPRRGLTAPAFGRDCQALRAALICSSIESSTDATPPFASATAWQAPSTSCR
jgi:hypothetical protein